MKSDQFDLNIQRLLRTEIRELRHRHAVEIALIHAAYTMKLQGPTGDQPAISQQVTLVVESRLFDHKWYSDKYQDAGQGELAAAEHYVQIGAFAGCDPGPNFETMPYYLANPDVAEAGWPALVHYLVIGLAQRRPLS